MMDINIVGLVITVSWIIFFLLFLFSGSMALRNKSWAKKPKIIFGVLIVVCIILLFALAIMIAIINSSYGKVVEAKPSKLEAVVDAKNIDIIQKDELIVVNYEDGSVGTYPDSIVTIYANPREKGIEHVNVSVREQKITTGIQIFGIWLVEPDAKTITTSVVFD